MQPEPQVFEYTTEWLPRGDFYALELLFDGWSPGAAIRQPATPSCVRRHPQRSERPVNPNAVSSRSPGGRLDDPAEIDAPQPRAVKVVLFTMGEDCLWGEGFIGRPINRLAFIAGINSTLEMSRAFPEIQERRLGLDGMAHKILLEAGYRYADLGCWLTDIPQYNEFDDNAQERFHKRLVVNPYGGLLPLAVDLPHLRAAIRGAGPICDSPYNELIDDQEVVARPSSTLADEVRPPDNYCGSGIG